MTLPGSQGQYPHFGVNVGLPGLHHGWELSVWVSSGNAGTPYIRRLGEGCGMEQEGTVLLTALGSTQ